MLLPARKSPALVPLYAAAGRRLLRRHFARVWLGGAPWPAASAGPVIAFPNHSAWWDPIVLLHLSHEVFRCDGYGLMQGAQLRRFPFFRHVGCFGTTDDGLDDARALVAHAGDVLRGAPGRTLWIFPQGELLPARRPLAFRSGLARLERAVPEAALVPVALRYELRAEQRPELWVRVGEGVPHGRPAAGAAGVARRTAPGGRALRAELAGRPYDLARADSLAAPPGYRVVLRGRGSLSALWERTAGRLGRGEPGRDHATRDSA
ncbi:lysophospholipid acyltransferase family protein [Roseisolibacter sp. H3M3-2]|uniref:lysophospholipid acyltransferase family protein n=1 Tax=Roseisolibacter sp. H3M3-2 TaxID=3031323 RepID=UPI0023D9D31E|nr:lysophospholipid acyltransferase family protein [Roseisolibacter sp. H3M3-2]MDF1503641.1 lysophospholipid acyltransferase family protein [Roseisolibacter sp. H3M3-2]